MSAGRMLCASMRFSGESTKYALPVVEHGREVQQRQVMRHCSQVHAELPGNRNFTLDRAQRNEFGQGYLMPRAMLKLGILIRDCGLWQGTRVLSASWDRRRDLAPVSRR